LIGESIAGCTAAPGEPPPVAGEPPGDPKPCSEVYGTQQCLAMTDEAASRTGRTRDDVTGILIVPLPTTENGVVIIRSGGGFTVRLTFTDGTTSDESMCGGIPTGPGCMDTPRLEARSIVQEGGGYRDVPCPDPPPAAGCGTPLPTLQPIAIAAARPLTVDQLKIPIDHVGAYEVPLGEAVLANGVVSSASFGFVDDWPRSLRC
jgi:hypothetical protein